jgi:hypothetical protein
MYKLVGVEISMEKSDSLARASLVHAFEKRIDCTYTERSTTDSSEQ